MSMTQQQLSQARCSTPGCKHENHQHLYIVSRCHPRSGVEVAYDLLAGTLRITCNECEGYICEVLVAPSEVQ